MSAQSTPIKMGLPGDARNAMVAQYAEGLILLATRAVCTYNFKSDDIVVFCIKVDSPWRYIIDMFMPDVDWQSYRDAGLEPVARGVFTFSFCGLLSAEFPDSADELLKKPEPGSVKCIALDENGYSIYEFKLIVSA